MSGRRGLGVALALGGLLVAAGAWSWHRTHLLVSGMRAHDALVAGDWAGVIAATEALVAVPDQDGGVHDALVDRCAALGELGRGDECFTLLDTRLFAADADNWAPPGLTEVWIDHAAASGRLADAATIANRARRLRPSDPDAFNRALWLSLASGEVAEVLRAAEAWPAEADPATAPAFRIRVAESWREQNDGPGMVRALGEEPPRESEVWSSWWQLRITGAVWSGNGAEARRLADAWKAAGGSEWVVEATYAVAMSKGSIRDPDATWIDLLGAAAEHIDEVPDPKLREDVFSRLLGHLGLEGRSEELARYLALANATDPTLVRADDIAEFERLIATGRATETAEGAGAGLRFVADHPVAEARLYLSPDNNQAVDGGWEEVVVDASGVARARRSLGVAPARWVYRTDERLFASGTVWPPTSGEATVEFRVHEPGTPIAQLDLAPGRPADGRRGVWVVVLDGGDWRVSSYLRQRGDMPVLHSLLLDGWRAGTLQQPPFTAAAMKALTSPGARESATVAGRVHELGIELAGLSSIGTNPFRPLEALLPAGTDLFAVLGAGELSVGNMLFSHGAVEAGRNLAVQGPHGAVGNLEVGPQKRPLTPEELEVAPGWSATSPRYPVTLPLVQTGAAQFDSVVQIIEEHKVDVLLFRLESLDIVTHGNFAAIARTAQDDGDGALFSYYRYIDLRLGQVARAMDGDDVLIVMSDHGIRTSMEHAPVAMFVAWGNGIPAGRVHGRPELYGISRVIADLAGVPTAWPDTGVAPWAADWHAGATPPGIGIPWTVPTAPPPDAAEPG